MLLLMTTEGPQLPSPAPLPSVPSAQAVEGFRNLLAICRDNGVNYLGFGCIHASPRQEIGLLEPSFAQVMADAGIRHFGLEQDKQLSDTIASAFERFKAADRPEREFEEYLAGMLARNFRTEYSDPTKGATQTSALAFGMFMAKAIIHADKLGITTHGVDHSQFQMIRAGRYFASDDPPAPAAQARELLDFFHALDQYKDIRDLRDLSGFRSDDESAQQIARLIDAQRKGGEQQPLMLGTHGAFHLSMPPSLDTILPTYTVKSAKIIMAADAQEMDVLRQVYNDTDQLEDLPPAIFCMQDGQWYDRVSGDVVQPSATLLSIQTPPDGAAPPAPLPPPPPPRIIRPGDEAPRAGPVRAAPLVPPPPGKT